MSQAEQQQPRGNPSSIASASVSVTKDPPSQAVVNSVDPAWSHCVCPNPLKKYSLQCNYCNKIFTGGITRIKYHIAGIKGCNVRKCKGVPTPVKEEITAFLTKKTSKKDEKNKEKERDRDGIDIDNSDDESSGGEGSDEGNEILVLKPQTSKGSSSSKSAACGSSIDKFYKPTSIEDSIKMMQKGVNLSDKVQTTLTTQKREERRDRACEYICQFFYEASISHNTVVRSECFWKNVDMAVNFFEPLANVLRKMDSDVPAMGFFHGLMLDAKKEVSERFDNDESRFKVAWDIIDKRWDNKLKTPLHLAGYYLNPHFYYPKKSEIEKEGCFREGVIACITRLIEDEATQDNIIEELNTYQDQQGSFGHDIAIRQRRNKNFNPAKWWLNHGTSTPNLRILASRILNLTCSSSACERNWSVFEQVLGVAWPRMIGGLDHALASVFRCHFASVAFIVASVVQLLPL